MSRLFSATQATRRTTIPTRGTDYCFMETFVAQCESGTLIRIREALLGRMKIGRCMSEDTHGGCYDVVTDDVKEKCEGKRYCEFYVGGLGPLVQSCPRDAMPYLNVWHDCVSGMEDVFSNTSRDAYNQKKMPRQQLFVNGCSF